MADFKGLPGLRAYKAMMAIVRSLYFIAEVSEGREYKEFLEWFDNQSKEELTRLFKVGVVYGIKLDQDEILDLVGYCKDKNGVKIAKENLNSIPVKELVDKMVDVCLELCEIKVFF
jgi:hypothetical protein